ncbi:MAG TPA: TA system VapC family ribonuclease toxin [Solirubrobacteraceae bacterium]|nr:TA system VapC family ribonuclease toxin [Solirubrobacteraceae bacterium]
MRLPDVNLLVYAADEEAREHEQALDWVETTLSGVETVAFAWHTLIGFLRVTTRSRGGGAGNPWPVEHALDVVDGWLAQPVATVIHPTDRHAAVLRDLLAPLGAGGNLTSDAHLAALAIEHGATLCSHDNDFSRFPGLRWEDPLAA